MCQRSALALATAVLVVPCRPARALEGCNAPLIAIERVVLVGLSATNDDTLLALLPRPAPSRYTPLELMELERRLNNLGIFDAVSVACEGDELRLAVREKWTLVPEVDFASGQTLADSYAMLGVTEYNFLGTAHQLALSAYREQRGFGVTIGFNQHDYQRHGWSLGSELSLSTVALRFEDDSGWRTTSATLELSARSPPVFHEYFNTIAGFYASSESVYDVQHATPPPSTQVLQSFLGLSWDGYSWNDLVPSGISASAWVSIGGLFGQEPLLPRHTLELLFRGALPLSSSAALITRTEASVGTRGNANYSFLLGSVNGVRGLPDATYFTWAQLLANAELRQALRIGERWALQGVLFTDGALFEQIDAAGGRGPAGGALSVGLGARLVPTWISSLVLRVDGARLIEPEGAWFAQLGLNQYF